MSSDVAVDSGQQVNLNLTIENTGNIGIDLTVSVLPDNPQWATQLNYDGEQDTRRIDITLGPGEVGTMNFIFAVPITAEGGRFKRIQHSHGTLAIQLPSEHHKTCGQG